MGLYNAPFLLSINDLAQLINFYCLTVLFWYIFLWALEMYEWHLPYRCAPFHCHLCCHVKPVSETSLSLEVQTKHCSTCVTKTTAKLPTCMFMSDFLASNIVTAVYVRLLYTHDYWMNLERVSRGKGDSGECIWQVLLAWWL